MKKTVTAALMALTCMASLGYAHDYYHCPTVLSAEATKDWKPGASYKYDGSKIKIAKYIVEKDGTLTCIGKAKKKNVVFHRPGAKKGCMADRERVGKFACLQDNEEQGRDDPSPYIPNTAD